MTRVVLARTFGGPEVLEIAEESVAEPGIGQVRIAVKAAGVNPGDAKELLGIFARDGSSLPLRLGIEVSGVVTAVGPHEPVAGHTLREGDEVLAFRVHGGYSSELIAPVSAVYRKPTSLGWNTAAGLVHAALTAHHVLETLGVTRDDTLIVHGASGAVGSMAIQLARLRGVRVVGTASERHHSLLLSRGVTPVRYGPGLAERLHHLLPEGATVAFDATGTAEAIDASVDLVADRTRIATISAYQRAQELGVSFIFAPAGDTPADREAVSHLIELAASGHLEVSLTGSFPLESAAEALQLVADGHAGGKIVLVP